jgi:hypothetical protein
MGANTASAVAGILERLITILNKKWKALMCFSAPASFVAGTALPAAGITTIRMTSKTAEIPFASIPLFFGIQQLLEGMIWLSFGNELLPNAALTFIYSFFSHVLWPIFVPFAVGLLETDPRRKKILIAFQIIGLGVGLYLLYYLVKFPITSRVLGKHIVYDSPHFYIVEVMVSSNRIIQIFGVMSLVTFVAAYAIHAVTLVSVWCFFAAVLSFIIYFYFRNTRILPLRENRFP